VIAGRVTIDREAVIPLSVRGPSGRRRLVEAVVDTGYDGWLSLPSSVIHYLGLAWIRTGPITLADGSEIEFNVYDAVVKWDGKLRHVTVDELEAAPLVGMALLSGHHLGIDV